MQNLVYRIWIIFTIVDGRVDGFYIEKNGSPYANIETDEGRTFFLIGIPCHSEFLKEEEVVSTCINLCHNLQEKL